MHLITKFLSSIRKATRNISTFNFLFLFPFFDCIKYLKFLFIKKIIGLGSLAPTSESRACPEPKLIEEIELPSNNFIPKQGRYQTVLPSTSLSIGVCVCICKKLLTNIQNFIYLKELKIFGLGKNLAPQPKPKLEEIELPSTISFPKQLVCVYIFICKRTYKCCFLLEGISGWRLYAVNYLWSCCNIWSLFIFFAKQAYHSKS